MKTCARDLVGVIGGLLLLSSCQWEIEPNSAPQGLAKAGDGGVCRRETELEGYPKCGVAFEAQYVPTCADPDVGPCPPPDDPILDCVCQVAGDGCLQQEERTLPDGGQQGPEFCFYRGEDCDCGDGRGAIYDCECEGGGDQCLCLEPDARPFIY